MIAHALIGVGNVDRSKPFYDAALRPLGYKCVRAARSPLGHAPASIKTVRLSRFPTLSQTR